MIGSGLHKASTPVTPFKSRDLASILIVMGVSFLLNGSQCGNVQCLWCDGSLWLALCVLSLVSSLASCSRVRGTVRAICGGSSRLVIAACHKSILSCFLSHQEPRLDRSETLAAQAKE